MNIFTKKIIVALNAFVIIFAMVFSVAMVDVKAEEIDEVVYESTPVTEDDATSDVEQPEDPTEPEEPEEEPVHKVIRYVIVDKAKVYKEASTKSKKLGYLTWKEEVNVLGKNKTWSEIEFDGTTGYVKNKYLASKLPVIKYVDSYTRYAKKKTKIYKAPSVYATKAGSYKKEAKIKCIGTCGSFTVIKKGKKELFVKTSYLKKKVSKKGSGVASYALKFKGNPYKWGGTSLTHGADCSGFTMSVFKHFGIKLPHSSSAQRKYGKAVSLKNAKAGDLVCYSGHVGIYIGGGKIVHASNPRGGIKVSSVHIMKIKTIRRLL
ncbi:MAG: C40 family peptidase [Lachnospiraceae bacterium]|nr:C40 family peptidase [Lachnospiraceae bacterium]